MIISPFPLPLSLSPTLLYSHFPCPHPLLRPADEMPVKIADFCELGGPYGGFFGILSNLSSARELRLRDAWRSSTRGLRLRDFLCFLALPPVGRGFLRDLGAGFRDGGQCVWYIYGGFLEMILVFYFWWYFHEWICGVGFLV